MSGNKLVFWWCCALLLVASSSKHQRNFTNNNEKHDFSTFNEYFVPYGICADDTCELFCCHLDDHLTECIPGKIIILQAFVDGQYSLQSKNQEINLTAYGLLYDLCRKIKQFHFIKYEDINKNVLIANGTVYFPYHAEFVESKSFCLMNENVSIFHIGCDITIFNINFSTEIVSRILIYKIDSPDSPFKTILNHYKTIGISLRIISILFLLTIFLVYSILPQLHNKHGFILRNCIGATIVTYIFESAYYLSGTIDLGNYFIESIIALICYFGFLAVYFWLTVISFDMWWTFRDISSLLANMRNRQREKERKMKERKKLIMYSVYAWGSSFILTIVCVIMDSVPPVIFSSLRPEFSIIFWFTKNMETGLYYWIPSTICSICSICLFISTVLKIRCYKKNTNHHLINVDSRVYDKYKNWFNLCQKSFIMTFIVIGISTFVIGIVSLIFPYTPNLWYISYIAQATDMAQNIGIFITFVCKKRIKKLLLTRFGYQNYNVPPIARQTEVVTDSNTRTIRSRMIRLRERINLWQTIRRRNNMHDETAK